METFRLLVNGEDVDTGVYEYFPYADQAITNSRETRRMIRELRDGLQPQGQEDYIYARYCVGNEETNQQALQAAAEASELFRDFSLSRRRKIMGDTVKCCG